MLARTQIAALTLFMLTLFGASSDEATAGYKWTNVTPGQHSIIYGMLRVGGDIEWTFSDDAVTAVRYTITNSATGQVVHNVVGGYFQLTSARSCTYSNSFNLNSGTYTLEVKAIHTDGQGNVTTVSSPPGYPLTIIIP